MFIKLQLELCNMKVVSGTIVFFRVFPFNIYLTASSSAHPKKPTINSIKPQTQYNPT